MTSTRHNVQWHRLSSTHQETGRHLQLTTSPPASILSWPLNSVAPRYVGTPVSARTLRRTLTPRWPCTC